MYGFRRELIAAPRRCRPQDVAEPSPVAGSTNPAGAAPERLAWRDPGAVRAPTTGRRRRARAEVRRLAGLDRDPSRPDRPPPRRRTRTAEGCTAASTDR